MVDVTEAAATGADLAVETGLKARVRPTLRHPNRVPMVQPQRQLHLRPRWPLNPSRLLRPRHPLHPLFRLHQLVTSLRPRRPPLAAHAKRRLPRLANHLGPQQMQARLRPKKRPALPARPQPNQPASPRPMAKQADDAVKT